MIVWAGEAQAKACATKLRVYAGEDAGLETGAPNKDKTARCVVPLRLGSLAAEMGRNMHGIEL